MIRVRVTATGAVAPPGVASSAQTATVISFGGGGTHAHDGRGHRVLPVEPLLQRRPGNVIEVPELATSNLLVSGNPDAVLPLGDLQYENGTLSEFLASYDLLGPLNDRREDVPVSGNHEYNTSGGAGYYQYWRQKTGQDKAHQATNGYYSFELGAWHIVVLNSNCSAVGGCGSTSPQVQWLRADLQAHPTQCTLAAWHHPLFNGTKDATIKTNGAFKPLWDALYQRGAEIVLNGHVHHYQRFAPMNPSGASDPTNGIREFIVGTGGIEKGGSSFVVGTLQATAKTYGVLKLTLPGATPGSSPPQPVSLSPTPGRAPVTEPRALPRELGKRPLDLRVRVLEVGELAGQVVVVGGHVEMAVAAEVEGDDLLLPDALHASASSMAPRIAWAASGAGMIALGPREGQRRLEDGVLRGRPPPRSARAS